MDNYILELKNKISEELSRAAHEYLENALNMFHKHNRLEYECSQAAIGNLVIAMELLLKSFLTTKNLSIIFKDIPSEIRIILSSPEIIPKFFEWRSFDVDLRSYKYKMIDFDECIAGFYIFFPELKQLLMPHINFLSKWRHTSLHGFLLPLHKFEFERIGFAVLSVIISLINDHSFHYSWYILTEDDKSFLRDFESKRNERVTMAVERAKNKSSETSSDHLDVIVAHNWETFPTNCPVCDFIGLLTGYTELALAEDEDGSSPTLDFFAITFTCEECGLSLNDIEELKLAGMNTLYDRSNDLDKWFKEHEDSSDLYLGKK